MKIRTIKYALYTRNKAFWISRQLKGEEIRLTEMRRLAGVLHPVERRSGLKAFKG